MGTEKRPDWWYKQKTKVHTLEVFLQPFWLLCPDVACPPPGICVACCSLQHCFCVRLSVSLSLSLFCVSPSLEKVQWHAAHRRKSPDDGDGDSGNQLQQICKRDPRVGKMADYGDGHGGEDNSPEVQVLGPLESSNFGFLQWVLSIWQVLTLPVWLHSKLRTCLFYFYFLDSYPNLFLF